MKIEMACTNCLYFENVIVKKDVYPEPCHTCLSKDLPCTKWKGKQKVSDNVNHPSHYTQGGIECIEAIKAAIGHLQGYEAACVYNIMKYVWRFDFKNGVEDLKKARRFLDDLIKMREGQEDA